MGLSVITGTPHCHFLLNLFVWSIQCRYSSGFLKKFVCLIDSFYFIFFVLCLCFFNWFVFHVWIYGRYKTPFMFSCFYSLSVISNFSKAAEAPILFYASCFCNFHRSFNLYKGHIYNLSLSKTNCKQTKFRENNHDTSSKT